MIGKRRRSGIVMALALSAAAGCRSSNPGKPAPDGGGLDDLFTDPAVPHCTQGPSGGANVELHGLLDGQRIDDATSLATNLDPQGYQVLEVVNGSVRQDVVLTWSDPLAENRAIPLTGDTFMTREGQPFATQPFCITQGVFGSPALAPGDPGRTLLYRITGARRGTCAGPDVAVSLAGCDFRANTYFPIPAATDAAADRSEAGDGPAACATTTPSDAGAACNTFPLTGAMVASSPLPTDDGGAATSPTGGALANGDYDLVRWQVTGAGADVTRRTIRVFGGGTRIEWAVAFTQNGTETVGRYNLRMTVSGSTLQVASVDCTADVVFQTTSYGYSVSGDDLFIFSTDNTGALVNIYTYRRTCTRSP